MCASVRASAKADDVITSSRLPAKSHLSLEWPMHVKTTACGSFKLAHRRPSNQKVRFERFTPVLRGVPSARTRFTDNNTARCVRRSM